MVIKNFKIATLSIFFLGMLFVACDTDDDVSVPHVYTEEEIAFADSLAAAQANVNADKLYTYDLVIPADSVNYSGVNVAVEMSEILQDLGYSNEAELTTALGEINGGSQTAQEVDFIAINGSTGYDYTSGYTANGFGFWFDAVGDVVSWGDTDAVFAEWDMETFTAFVGQHPGRLEPEQEVRLIQVFQKEDYRVAVVFNILADDYIE